MTTPMLASVADGPAVVACNLCRFSRASPTDPDGVRGGVRLVEALRAVKAANPAFAAIAVQEMPCLFACGDHCTVHIRAEGKIGYVLGRFVPDEAAARAILGYAACYAASAEGVVDYADWPPGIRGHFITRTPPTGFVATE